jgi:hypothetical protein
MATFPNGTERKLKKSFLELATNRTFPVADPTNFPTADEIIAAASEEKYSPLLQLTLKILDMVTMCLDCDPKVFATAVAVDDIVSGKGSPVLESLLQHVTQVILSMKWMRTLVEREIRLLEDDGHNSGHQGYDNLWLKKWFLEEWEKKGMYTTLSELSEGSAFASSLLTGNLWGEPGQSATLPSFLCANIENKKDPEISVSCGHEHPHNMKPVRGFYFSVVYGDWTETEWVCEDCTKCPDLARGRK